ncbi:MAG: HAMP domain-containing histidine kinase, partial [Balneolales bacterium]|nr:HAMP domain-containing histidine kinase [Balneolales bacterium]
YLVEKILQKERMTVELWAKAIEYNALPINQQVSTQLLILASELRQYQTIPDSIINRIIEIENLQSATDFVTNELILNESWNSDVPAVVVDENDEPLASMIQSGEDLIINYQFKNVSEGEIDSPEKRAALVQKLKETNPPIRILVGDENTQIEQYVYYGESFTVQILRYFPYIQIILLSLLLGIGYTTYQSIKRTEQSNLWVGMAKEAAHQLGTPISSLFGWIHLFRDDYKADENAQKLIAEIENDVQRLSNVAERFGKIGSTPELKKMSIEPVLMDVVSYLEKRLPQLGRAVDVKKQLHANAEVAINPELFQWAVENLVKNSMDALKKAGQESFIAISSKEEEGQVIIDIQDSGSGIESKNTKNVFRPGYSTKKRGWGLGLSLTKRIIEDYHSGKVFVLNSEIGKGTTMRIILNTSEA